MACRKGIIVFFFAASLEALAPETPWTEVDKLLYVEPFVGYSHLGPFPRKKVHHDGHRHVRKISHDLFLQGISFYFTPDPDWQIFTGGSIAEASHRHFIFNNLKIAISHPLTDDIQGDCFSSTISIDARAVDRRALREPAFFHFGEWEWRAIFSIGKERSCCGDWIDRYSGYGTFGLANRGSPWVEGGIKYEHNWEECQRLALGFDFLQGLGRREIKKTPFHLGWAPYRFTLLSVGGSYTKILSCGEVTLSVEKTLWTTDTFANVVSANLSVTIPF